MSVALVIGVNGQDGTLLARHLVATQYRVVGLGRQIRPTRTFPNGKFAYHQADLRQRGVLETLLHAVRPDLIFQMAAVHTSAGGRYEPIWRDALDVNVGSLHVVLEYLRDHNPGGRLIYASSGKVFGEALPEVIDETTPMRNDCLYSITKNAAFHLLSYYRSRHSVAASVVFLFNHESEFRPDDFFIPKVLACLAAAKKNKDHITRINSFDFFCDWGSAEEYMKLVTAMIESAPREDFVLGTGTCTYARDLVRTLFLEHDLDFSRHLIETKITIPMANQPYRVDTRKLKDKIGTLPQESIYDVCARILNTKYGLSAAKAS